MSVNHVVNMMSPQSLTVVFGTCILIVLATIMILILRIPYGSFMYFVMFCVIIMVIQGISVNCMVHGGCDSIAWIFATLTLLNILVLLLRAWMIH
jgi:hypothetical protein